MVQLVIENYFGVVLALSFIGLAMHLCWLLLGFDDDWSVFTFVGKAGSTANVAIIIPLLASINDPSVFSKINGNDAVVILAAISMGYFAISNIVPRFLAEKIKRGAAKRFKQNMDNLGQE